MKRTGSDGAEILLCGEYRVAFPTLGLEPVLIGISLHARGQSYVGGDQESIGSNRLCESIDISSRLEGEDT